MEYTITFTPESIAEHFNTPIDFVEEHWGLFEEYLFNFENNWMGDVVWEYAESNILEQINDNTEEKLYLFPQL